jgi:hypothetical protein
MPAHSWFDSDGSFKAAPYVFGITIAARKKTSMGI